MDTEPRIETRTEQRYVALRADVPMDGIPQIADRFPELFGWLAERGLETAGAPFLRYLAVDMATTLLIDAGIPVDAVVEPTGEVIAAVLPAGRYATADHVGPYDGLRAANAALLAWADEQGVAFDVVAGDDGERWGCRLEIYVSDPADEPDPQRWRTTLAFRLAD